MTFTVLGRGPEAVRLRLGAQDVEILVAGAVIRGNRDLRAAIELVLSQPPPVDGQLPQLGASVQEICAVLRQLARHGVPLDLWPAAWAAAGRDLQDRPADRTETA